MSIKSHLVLAGAAAVLALGGCNKDATPSGAAQGKDPAAATVNGVPISARRVDMLIKMRGQGAQDTPEVRKQTIDQLALQMTAAQEAEKKGLDKTPEVLDQIDVQRVSTLANAYVQDYLKNAPVTDDMLKAEYEKAKAAMGGEEYQARHILVAKEADAKDIIAKLKKDIKLFPALAKEKSTDPGSKANGGELGWFDPRKMVPEFGAAVAKLEKGKFTEEPVKTQFGYHVILLEDSRPKTVPPSEDMKDQLKQGAQQQSVQKLIEDLKAKSKIEIAESSGAPASAPAPAAPAPSDATKK
jgi:peptidyl-prolyl cis-trans isomerase C